MKLTTSGRVARNSIAVTSAMLIKRGSSFVLYLLIARHLGVLAFGQFSLVYTLFIIFQIPAMFGLPNLIVREVAKNKSDFDKYLINGHIIILFSSLVSLGIWALAVHLLGYSRQVIVASYILGLALMPFAMCRVCEAIFQAFERMQFMVYAFAAANLTMLALAWLLLSRGFSLYWIVGLLAVIQGIMLIIEWYFIFHFFPRPSWAINLDFCAKLAKVATTFLGIGIFNIIFMRLNVIVLSKLAGEVAVGLYNAAFQLAFFFMIASRSIKDAIYPVLSRTFTGDLSRFKRYSERSIELLVSMGLPMAIAFAFLADSILPIYKEEFVAAAPVLRILGWILVPLSFERILGGILLASGQQRANLIITMINTVILGILSGLCIYNFGLVGAGWALLITLCLSFALHYGLVSLRIFTISIPRVAWRPAISGLFLAGFLALAWPAYGLRMVIPLAVVIYGTVLIGLNYYSGGPLGSWKAVVLKLRSGSRAQETEI